MPEITNRSWDDDDKPAPIEYLNYLLEYRDGNLYWKVKRSNKTKMGVAAGCVSKVSGYRLLSIDGVLHRVHRLIWIMHYVPIPKDMEIDHINGVRDDNRIDNLRLATRLQNNGNTHKHKDNTSGLKGVSLSNGVWVAHIGKNRKSYCLGRFKTKEEAHDRYKKAAIEYFGEFAKFSQDNIDSLKQEAGIK